MTKAKEPTLQLEGGMTLVEAVQNASDLGAEVMQLVGRDAEDKGLYAVIIIHGAGTDEIVGALDDFLKQREEAEDAD